MDDMEPRYDFLRPECREYADWLSEHGDELVTAETSNIVDEHYATVQHDPNHWGH